MKNWIVLTICLGLGAAAGSAVTFALAGKAETQITSRDAQAPTVGDAASTQLDAPSADRPERTVDGRLAIYIGAEERAHVRTQMLGFLSGLQVLNAAALDEDRATIRSVALDLAQGEQSPVAASLRAKTPDGFRQISKALREDFGSIAKAADTAPMYEIQQLLSDTMSKCTACHGTYAVTETPGAEFSSPALPSETRN